MGVKTLSAFGSKPNKSVSPSFVIGSTVNRLLIYASDIRPSDSFDAISGVVISAGAFGS